MARIPSHAHYPPNNTEGGPIERFPSTMASTSHQWSCRCHRLQHPDSTARGHEQCSRSGIHAGKKKNWMVAMKARLRARSTGRSARALGPPELLADFSAPKHPPASFMMLVGQTPTNRLPLCSRVLPLSPRRSPGNASSVWADRSQRNPVECLPEVEHSVLAKPGLGEVESTEAPVPQRATSMPPCALGWPGSQSWAEGWLGHCRTMYRYFFLREGIVVRGVFFRHCGTSSPCSILARGHQVAPLALTAPCPSGQHQLHRLEKQ